MEQFSTTIDLEKQKKYDEICGIAYVNLFTLSKEWDKIVLAPFNPKNKEHLFILSIAKGLGGVNNKDVYLDASKLQIWKLNRGIDKECRYHQINGKDIMCAINPQMLLDYMRDYAVKLCGENFNFGNIYDEFFAKKGKK